MKSNGPRGSKVGLQHRVLYKFEGYFGEVSAAESDAKKGKQEVGNCHSKRARTGQSVSVDVQR